MKHLKSAAFVGGRGGGGGYVSGNGNVMYVMYIRAPFCDVWPNRFIVRVYVCVVNTINLATNLLGSQQ